jgi:hypothetical protein
MTEKDAVVQNVRAAFGDRAIYLGLLYRSFSQALSPEQAEALARKAIYEFGQLKGKADNGPITADSWVDHHVACGGAAIFETEIVRADDRNEMHMTFCPLMTGWKQMGCSASEMDLLCDIAMEVDRGRADYHGIPYEISERLAKGDHLCRLVLKKSRG